MDIRQFIKRKRISDSQNVEKVTEKGLRIEVQPARTNM